METGMGELIMLALISVIILGPRETHRIAHKLGTWLRQIRLLGDEFKRELQREADVIEWRERTAEIERSIMEPTVGAAGAKAGSASSGAHGSSAPRVEYDGRDLEGLAGYHPPGADPSDTDPNASGDDSGSACDALPDPAAGAKYGGGEPEYADRPDLHAAPVTDDYAESASAFESERVLEFESESALETELEPDLRSEPAPDVAAEIDALSREGVFAPSPDELNPLAPESSIRA